MAVKTKKAKVASQDQAPVAVPQKAPQATTVVAGSLDDALAMVEGAGVAAAPAKAKKNSVPVVEVKGIDLTVMKLALAAAQEAAAKGRKEAESAILRPQFDAAWLKYCRDHKSFVPSVDVNSLIGYIGGQLSVAVADDKKPVSPCPAGVAPEGWAIKAINAALKEHFGASYSEYVEPSLSLFIKPRAELEAAGLTLAGVVKTLQEKLGADFGKMFGHSQGIDLKRVKSGSDEVVVLRQRAVLDPSVDALVNSAIGKGLLSKSNGALKPSNEAKLNAERRLAELEKEKAKATTPTVQVNVGK